MKRLTLVILALFALGAACGDDDSPSAGADARTVTIEMKDIAFEPDVLEVRRGETVRFVFRNTGKVAHDAFIGDKDAQADHEREMREADDEGHGHGATDDAVTVEPGKTAELTHTFDEAGTVEIGCHQAGHYQAGMKVTVEVS